jgi:hypothetical protein
VKVNLRGMFLPNDCIDVDWSSERTAQAAKSTRLQGMAEKIAERSKRARKSRKRVATGHAIRQLLAAK